MEFSDAIQYMHADVCPKPADLSCGSFAWPTVDGYSSFACPTVDGYSSFACPTVNLTTVVHSHGLLLTAIVHSHALLLTAIVCTIRSSTFILYYKYM